MTRRSAAKYHARQRRQPVRGVLDEISQKVVRGAHGRQQRAYRKAEKGGRVSRRRRRGNQ